MNRYSDFYLNNVRLILLTKYSYKTVHDIENLQRVDLSLVVNNNKNVISSLTALELLSQRGVRTLIQKKKRRKF